MATKKNKPKKLNRFPDGVYRDAEKEKLQMTHWMKKNTSKQTKNWRAVKDFSNL